MRQAPPTKEHRLPLIGLWRREDAAVPQVVTQHDGEARLVERLHDDRADRLVVGEEVEDGEEEEEAEGQSGGRRGAVGGWVGGDGERATGFQTRKAVGGRRPYGGLSVTSGMRSKLSSRPARFTRVSWWETVT